eukprot:4686323-Prymnesium_polylepis.1
MSTVKLHIFSTYLHLLLDAAFAATWVGPATHPRTQRLPPCLVRMLNELFTQSCRVSRETAAFHANLRRPAPVPLHADVRPCKAYAKIVELEAREQAARRKCSEAVHLASRRRCSRARSAAAEQPAAV